MNHSEQYPVYSGQRLLLLLLLLLPTWHLVLCRLRVDHHQLDERMEPQRLQRCQLAAHDVPLDPSNRQ
uniref:Putative secreted protein n=1 Tax=Anopheles darlingi TaxID=43151 RepID=A0A2M4D775_ANODA